MKLQIALDLLDLQQVLQIAHSVEQHADSFQIGLPLLLKYGMHVIEEFKVQFPDKEIFAETQIVNHESDITAMALKAGAHWVSVMAGTTKEAVHTVTSIAHQKNKLVIMDMFNNNSLGQSAMDAQKLGVHALLYHPTHDQEQITLEEWEDLRGNSKLPIYVRANINRENIDFITSLQPDTVVIGKAITQAHNPSQEAEYFYTYIHNI